MTLTYFNRVLRSRFGKETKDYDPEKAFLAVAAALGLGAANAPAASALTVAPLREWKVQPEDLRHILRRMEKLTRLRDVVDQVARKANDPELRRTPSANWCCRRR